MIQYNKVNNVGVHFGHYTFSKLLCLFSKRHHLFILQLKVFNFLTLLKRLLHTLCIFGHSLKFRLTERCSQTIPKEEELRLQLFFLQYLISIHNEFLNLKEHCFHVFYLDNDNTIHRQTKLKSIIFIVAIFATENHCYSVFRIFLQKRFHSHETQSCFSGTRLTSNFNYSCWKTECMKIVIQSRTTCMTPRLNGGKSVFV